jgi:flagellar hook-associated protein 2
MTVTLDTTSLYSGQGFNVQDIVNQILDSERGQETQWKTEQTTLQSQTTALDQLQSQISTLSTDANSLTDFSGVMGAVTASSSDPGVVIATATSSAATANHILQVQNLATTGAAYSSDVASGATLDPGTLTITVGSNTQTVDVGTTNTSLSAIASAINDLKMGVTANVQTDSTGSRLTVTSSSSGGAAGVSVTGGTSQLSFTNLAGQDALVNVDGIPYQSSTNTITGAISGVTLNLASADPNTDVTLSVSPDVSSVATALNTFVTDYNSVVTSLNSQFTYDSSTNSAGVLSGDSSVRMVQDSLLSLASFSMTGNGTINTLQDLGVTMQDDGTLSVDSDTLNSALTNNFATLQSFFQGGTGSFGDALTTAMTTLNDPSDGAIALDLNDISQTNQDLTTQINNFEANLTAQQQVLTDEYSQVNAQLQELPLLQSQVSSELGSLDPYSSSSSTSSSSSSSS